MSLLHIALSLLFINSVTSNNCLNSPQIAILFTGQLRTFSLTYPHLSANLLDGLSPGCPSNVHLFMYPSGSSRSLERETRYEVNLRGESQLSDEGGLMEVIGEIDSIIEGG